MRNERPIVEALQKFVVRRPQSLHVPGHKNGLYSNLPKEIQSALLYDLTELTGLDDFHHPEGVIAEAEKLLAKTYGADQSFFLVNGSTVGNLAMLYATCERDDTVLVQRNAHKSVFHAIELTGVKPVYLAPEWDEETQTASAVSLATVQEALVRYPHAKAIVLTYPSYYGVVAQHLREIITLCHAQKIAVLVDEAHGAHFIVSNKFPTSALVLGADVVVQSAHKTLPAMTMGSFLHIKSQLVNKEKVNHYLRILQSSSPSYLLLASLDDARAFVGSYLEIDAAYTLEKRSQWLEALRSIKGIHIVEPADPLKVLIRLEGFTGMELKDALEQEGLFVELADLVQVLVVLPLLKRGDVYPFAEARSKIKDAVVKLQKGQGSAMSFTEKPFDVRRVTATNITFDELAQQEKEWIPYMRSIDRIAAAMLIPYPPGIPLLVPGEKITVSKLSQLEELLAAGASFQGEHRLQEKLIQVLK